MFEVFLFINLYTCIALVGLIWMVQLVHYPSFHYIDKQKFSSFESFHGFRISLVVIPLMLLELFSGVLILFIAKSDLFFLISLAFTLLVLVWLVTFLISVPLHGKLLTKYNEDIVDKLISTNWWRTGLWTLRSLILTYIIWKA